MPLYPRNRGLLVAMEIPTGRQQPSDGYCSSQKYPLGSTTLSAQSDSSFSSLVVDSLSTVSLLSKGGICSVIGEDWSSEFRRGLERSAFGEASSAEVPFSPSTSPSGSSWSWESTETIRWIFWCCVQRYKINKQNTLPLLDTVRRPWRVWVVHCVIVQGSTWINFFSKINNIKKQLNSNKKHVILENCIETQISYISCSFVQTLELTYAQLGNVL